MVESSLIDLLSSTLANIMRACVLWSSVPSIGSSVYELLVSNTILQHGLPCPGSTIC